MDRNITVRQSVDSKPSRDQIDGRDYLGKKLWIHCYANRNAVLGK